MCQLQVRRLTYKSLYNDLNFLSFFPFLPLELFSWCLWKCLFGTHRWQSLQWLTFSRPHQNPSLMTSRDHLSQLFPFPFLLSLGSALFFLLCLWNQWAPDIWQQGAEGIRPCWLSPGVEALPHLGVMMIRTDQMQEWRAQIKWCGSYKKVVARIFLP